MTSLEVRTLADTLDEAVTVETVSREGLRKTLSGKARACIVVALNLLADRVTAAGDNW